ncbi:MAG: hypothetical protein Q7T86_19200 [Hyphomicrobiaceae bacterium]|nr:hypothetical protein [Hyphomicrobiaceae bacterium]
MFDKQLHNLKLALVRRAVQGRVAQEGRSLGIRFGLAEKLHNMQVTCFRRQMKRRMPILVGSIGVGADLKELSARLRVALLGCAVQFIAGEGGTLSGHLSPVSVDRRKLRWMLSQTRPGRAENVTLSQMLRLQML